jgi:hypothetical protein
MKYTIYILALLSLMSCEKVIQVDLNNGNPQYVIEAVLLAGENDFTAKITQTTSFFDPQTPKRIENAVVKLYDGDNVSHILQYIGDGKYELVKFIAYAQQGYRLHIEVDGKTFDASIQMPKLVPIEKIDFELVDGEDGFGKQMKVSFQDQVNEKNYYKLNSFQQSLGSSFGEDFNTSDFGFDGKLLTETFESLYITGDSVIVQLWSIDYDYYEYFVTLDNALGDGGGPGGAAPANPTTNWSNGALGYFGSGNIDAQTLIVP